MTDPSGAGEHWPSVFAVSCPADLGKLFAALATAHKWSRAAYAALRDERDPRIDCERCWSSCANTAIWTQFRMRNGRH